MSQIWTPEDRSPRTTVRLPLRSDHTADELALAILEARRPLPTTYVNWKVQTVGRNQQKEPTGGWCVAYLDRAGCIDMLNRVFGTLWYPEYRPTSSTNLMWCDLHVADQVRTDLGESDKGLSKDLVTDSLKRAATQYGVGISINDVPAIWVSATKLRKYRTRNGESLAMTDNVVTELDGIYEGWLADVGVKRFGEPLLAPSGQPRLQMGHAPDEEAPERPTEESASKGSAGNAQAGAFDQPPQQQEQAAGPPPLELMVREALAMVGEVENLINAKINGARGNEAVLRTLLENATQKWHAEHGKDEPPPWAPAQAKTDGNGQQQLTP